MSNLGLRKRLTGSRCVYCGQLADCIDHFPPQSLTFVGWLLPACKECNYFAGTFYGLDFWERVEYIRRLLRNKYGKVLNVPDWTKNEMRELGYSLKRLSKVESWKQQKEVLKERLVWNVKVYLFNIDHDNAFANWLAETTGTTKKEKEILKNLENYVEESVIKIIPDKVNFANWCVNCGCGIPFPKRKMCLKCKENIRKERQGKVRVK
jgi:hypothetical protein